VEAKAVADEANLAKSRFLAMMSHELRTPLNAVIGFSEFLSLEALGPLNEKQKIAVSNIHKGGTLLLNLVSDLLDFAKVESGEFDICIENISLAEVVDTAITFVEDQAKARLISIHWTGQIQTADGAALPGKAQATGDKLRLVQSVVNLLSNAIKYNDVGGDIWVTLKDNQASGHWIISVRDNGCGIKPEQLESIFEAFNRGYQKSSHIEGTGLGLNVAKRLLAAMGGEIQVESVVGEGATFHLHLLKTVED